MVELTVLGSGSSGNAVAIKYQHDVLLIDAGFSGVELARRLNDAGTDPEEIIGILISHEHDDHIQGVRVFAKRHGNIPTYLNSLTGERLKLMKKSPERICVFSNGVPFRVGSFDVEAFSVCHDAVDPVGFVIRCQGRKIGIATDLGYAGQMVPLKLRDSHLVILESNHDPDLLRKSRRPAHLQHRILSRRGHLSNQSAAELLPAIIGPLTQHVILAHLSDDCNHPDLVLRIIQQRLMDLNRDDINVCIARQDTVGETIAI